VHLNLFGHNLYWDHPSGWSCTGTGSSFAASAGVRDIPTPAVFLTAGISLGAAWGHVRFAPNYTSEHYGSGLDSTRGHRLRDRPRWYEATMVGLTIGASAQTITFQLPVGGQVSMASADFPSGGIGPVLRMNGAPDASGEGGPPTGFLGVALQYSGGIGTSQGRSNVAYSSLLMGSNIAGILAGAPSWLADNLGHAGDLIGHAGYKYSACYWSNSAVVSTALASAGASLEFQMAYLGMLDMYVKEDDQDWYVHSYRLDGNNRVETIDRSFNINAPSYRINR
jgi:hypothetical protein